MNVVKTGFEDLYIIEYNAFKDQRGEFVKTIHEETFAKANLNWRFAESFYSVSYKNVVRGMHYQAEPHDHDKLVFVISGRITDVVLDIRRSSKTYGEYFSIELSAEKRNALYIGKGFAHGFLGLANENIVEYHTTTVQNREAERGIKWDSFGFDWNINDPILSERDNSFEDFYINTEYLT